MSSEQPDWRTNSVRIIHSNDLDLNTPKPQTCLSPVIVQPNAKTGALHQGDLETVLHIVRGPGPHALGRHLEFVDVS